ncbi:hypothetical protein HYH03_015973 [Edaphochlamys debaryana]|uniref:BTB domain-containing protein n=1 Tax=Edaphochlamys debaryana TaxID=47281 RepID=A0A835XSP6_9CHLO|nr:hypothetical protein HYH03_015973 [Edaphochlamys debaryana]|eukprot:KAG2485299.1 hypothetical protein HYH03_015973 [Edaphochlamys debaryana]
MGNRSLTLVCKGGASVEARTATLVSASPVLDDALQRPLAKAGELRLEEDDAAARSAALRLLEPDGHADAALLSWENIESVMHLADKYDMAAVRIMCAGFLGTHRTDVNLDHPLASPKNTLRLATLFERYFPQLEQRPDLNTFLGPVLLAIGSSVQANNDLEKTRTLLGQLREAVTHPRYKELVSPQLQDVILGKIVGELYGMACSCSLQPQAPCKYCKR